MRKLSLTQKLRSTAVVTTCSLAAFAGIGVYKNNENVYDRFLMPVVRFLSPEFCHRMAVLGFKFQIFPKQKRIDSERLKTNLFGINLSNPVGIAAGFDKHGEAVVGLKGAGFGYVEIGSVTPEPQPGNDKPRVFRLVEDEALVNRYGFNSVGHEEAYNNLKKLRANPGGEDIVLGVNLGKNKQTKEAHEDYVKGIYRFADVADYFVVNVSSPNTPGLRNLQQKDDLKLLLSKVLSARDSLKVAKKPPVLLKIAPDLTEGDVRDIVSVITSKGCRVDGLIISNTTIERSESLKSEAKAETGGLSGRPLTQRSTELVAKFYKLTKGSIPIIGVGGIFSGRDAFDKIAAGASSVQLYTSMICHGPPIIQKVKRELDELLESNGFENVANARGTKATEWAK